MAVFFPDLPAMDHPLSRPTRPLSTTSARARGLRAATTAVCVAALAAGLGPTARAQTAAARGDAKVAAPAPSAASGPRVQTLSKCTGADGRVTYSDSACPAGSRGAALQVAPDSNVVATTPVPAGVPSPASVDAQRPPPALPVVQPYQPPPNAGMPARQAADCALLDRRAATLYGRAMQPQTGDNPQLLPNEQRSVEDLRQHLGCE